MGLQPITVLKFFLIDDIAVSIGELDVSSGSNETEEMIVFIFITSP
jgi:hypothetical protein